MRFLTLIASIIATLAKVGVSLSLFAIIFVSWISVVSLKCLRDEGRKIEDLAWDILELLCNTLMRNLNFSPKNQFWWILLQNWIWIFPPKNGIIENLIFLTKIWILPQCVQAHVQRKSCHTRQLHTYVDLIFTFTLWSSCTQFCKQICCWL